MELKIQRSQRMGGVMGGTVHFCLDIRADYSPEERANINKYRLGGEVIYRSGASEKHLANAAGQIDGSAKGYLKGLGSMALAKLNLNVTIASLGRGHHIECKDMQELLEGETTLREACKNITAFLAVAETFNGSEVVISYENGEEKVHIEQAEVPLLTGEPSRPDIIETQASERGIGGRSLLQGAGSESVEEDVRRFAENFGEWVRMHAEGVSEKTGIPAAYVPFIELALIVFLLYLIL
jgi:hypothetical protein